MTSLLAKLTLAIAVLAFVATLAIAVSRSDLPEERSGNQQPAGVQRVEPLGRDGSS
jgi:hypothetical protein